MFVIVKYPREAARVQKVDMSDNPHGWLDFLKGVVGGKLELVRLTPKFDLWLNEEGKLLDLEPNLLMPSDIIVGPVVITGHKGAETIGLESEDAELLCNVLNVNHAL